MLSISDQYFSFINDCKLVCTWWSRIGFMVVLTPLSTICQLHRDGQFYWWRKSKNPEKTTDLPQITDKLYHTVVYTSLSSWAVFELTTSVVIGTDCNYHTITATMATGLGCDMEECFNCYNLKMFPRAIEDNTLCLWSLAPRKGNTIHDLPVVE